MLQASMSTGAEQNMHSTCRSISPCSGTARHTSSSQGYASVFLRSCPWTRRSNQHSWCDAWTCRHSDQIVCPSAHTCFPIGQGLSAKPAKPCAKLLIANGATQAGVTEEDLCAGCCGRSTALLAGRRQGLRDWDEISALKERNITCTSGAPRKLQPAHVLPVPESSQ